MRKTIAAALVVAAFMLTLAGTAFAGKPSSSLSLVLVSPSQTTALASAAAEASYGSDVTFDVSSSETNRPFVNLRCYQNGAFVYDAWHGFFASYAPEPNFTLASSYWLGGAADCTARLVEWSRNGRERTLASLDFHVSA
jgi:hypothetical protein